MNLDSALFLAFVIGIGLAILAEKFVITKTSKQESNVSAPVSTLVSTGDPVRDYMNHNY